MKKGQPFFLSCTQMLVIALLNHSVKIIVVRVL